MIKKIILFGSTTAFLSVAFGAMGAHALKAHLSIEQLATFETAVRYQFAHALAILLVAALLDKLHFRFCQYSFYFFVSGVFLFSGSLYLLALRELLQIHSYKWLGPITPIGGICFLAGWVSFFLAAWKGGDKTK